MTQEPAVVHGHPAGSVTDGFSGVARWLQLLRVCLRDITSDCAISPWNEPDFWSTTAVYIITPHLDSERYYPNPRCTPEGVQAALVTPFRSILGAKLPPRSIQVVPRGRIGLYELINSFDHLRRTNGFTRVLALAVDSWLDGPSLSYLLTMGRLKTNSNPVGLIPGEGAFAVLLEPLASVQARDGVRGPVIRGCAHGKAEHSLLGDEQSTGNSLAEQIRQVFTTPPPAPSPMHILDLNGEPWRALEWGGALSKLQSQGLRVEQHRQWLPAASVGEVGAGTSTLSMILATRAFARSYSEGSQILISNSDEHGDVGAMLLEKG